MMTFIIMGWCNALAAIVVTGRTSVAMPNVGVGMEMERHRRGDNRRHRAEWRQGKGGRHHIGCFILGIISNLLNLAGIGSFWQWIVKGIIIIIAMLVDTRTEAFFNKRRTLNAG
jgi:ribose transport system permease protein